VSNILLRTEQLGKCYRSGQESHWVFRHLNFELIESQSVSLTGPSGSGKSSLLNVLGLLTKPDEGELFIDNKPLKDLTKKQIEDYRSDSIGFVFQKHLLLPELSLLENICLPLAKKSGWSKSILEKGMSWLEDYKLDHRAKALPKELSGGEAQRGAIIRALIHKPSILLLDEPTGNLDPQHSHDIIEHILIHTQKNKCSVLLVTHDMELAQKTDLKGNLKQESIEWQA